MLSAPAPSVVSFDQLSEDHVHLSSEYLQGWRSHNISGEPSTVFQHHHHNSFCLVSHQNFTCWSSWLLHSLLLLSFIPGWSKDSYCCSISPWPRYHRPATICNSCQSEGLEVVNIDVAHNSWDSTHFICSQHFFHKASYLYLQQC